MERKERLHSTDGIYDVYQLPEYVVQAGMTVVLLFSGKWLAGLFHAGMAAYNGRTYLRGDHRVDATDIFQKVAFQKRLRIGKLVFYLASFILIIYRFASIILILTAYSRSDPV